MLQIMQMNCTAWPVAQLGICEPEETEERFIKMRLLLFEDLKGWLAGTTQTCPPRKRMGNFRKALEKKRTANSRSPDFKMVATYFRREKGLLFSFVPFHSTQPKRSITSLFVRFGEEKTPDLGSIPWL